MVPFVLRKVGAATLNLGAQELCIGIPMGAEGAGLTDRDRVEVSNPKQCLCGRLGLQTCSLGVVS